MSSEDLNDFVSMRNQCCYSNKRADQNKRVGREDFFFHLLHEKLWVWCKFSTFCYMNIWKYDGFIFKKAKRACSFIREFRVVGMDFDWRNEYVN